MHWPAAQPELANWQPWPCQQASSFFTCRAPLKRRSLQQQQSPTHGTTPNHLSRPGRASLACLGGACELHLAAIPALPFFLLTHGCFISLCYLPEPLLTWFYSVFSQVNMMNSQLRSSSSKGHTLVLGAVMGTSGQEGLLVLSFPSRSPYRVWWTTWPPISGCPQAGSSCSLERQSCPLPPPPGP